LQRFVGDRIMLRQCCKLLRRPVTISHHNTVRAASSQAGGGGGVKVLAGTVLVTAGTAGGVVGYCALDEDFRKTVEESVPGSGDILDAILGEKTPLKPPTPLPPPPSKLKIRSPIVETKPKVEPKPLDASLESKPALEVKEEIPAPAPVTSVEKKQVETIISLPPPPPPPVEIIPEVEKPAMTEETVKTEEAPVEAPPTAPAVAETPVEAPIEVKEEKEEVTPSPAPAVAETPVELPVEVKQKEEVTPPAAPAVDHGAKARQTRSLQWQLHHGSCASSSIFLGGWPIHGLLLF